MKKCAFCAEKIQSEAKKCKHCGEFLSEEVKTKDERKSGIGDFSRCKILKEGPADVRCPKCGFHGITKEIKGDYNPIIFWILFLLFPVVGGILYYLFTLRTKYVCPKCDSDYLEVFSQVSTDVEVKEKKKTNGNTIGIIILIGFIGLMLIVLLGGK